MVVMRKREEEDKVSKLYKKKPKVSKLNHKTYDF